MDEHSVQRHRVERNALYQEFLRSQPIEIAGVEEVLAELAPRHRMAIVTTARRSDFELIHAERDLLGHFEFVLTVDDYARSKPHPDPYLAALARLGAEPHETIAIEDSTRGLKSARAAGIPCVVIRSSLTASEEFPEAWRVVDSISEIPRVLVGEPSLGCD